MWRAVNGKLTSVRREKKKCKMFVTRSDYRELRVGGKFYIWTDEGIEEMGIQKVFRGRIMVH